MKSSLLLATAGLLALAAPAFADTTPECASGATLDQRVAGVMAHADRPADQVAMDANRTSETRFVLGYIEPGDHVLDLGSGPGYASMLLSAAICDGQLDSQNPPEWDAKYGDDKARTAMAAARPNVHLISTTFDGVPQPAQPYDAIFVGTIYHDTYNVVGHDALKLDMALFNALKPGGLVILTDHRTVDGAGATQTDSLHRIDKATVLADFKAAGFELVADSDALANPADDHSKIVFDPSIRGHTDRMALVFRKPN